MADIRLAYNPEIMEYDIFINDEDIETGDDIETAIIISLFTWRRANPDDKLDSGQSRFGWFGDKIGGNDKFPLGSRLYLLARKTITPQTMREAEEFASEALKWMVEDKVVSSISCASERVSNERVDLRITYTRDGISKEKRFNDLWQQIEEKKHG